MNSKTLSQMRRKAEGIIKEARRLGFKGNLYKEYKLIWYRLSSKMKSAFRKKLESSNPIEFYNYVFFSGFDKPIRTKSRKKFDKHYTKQRQRMSRQKKEKVKL